jgi:hypothetical protein
MSDSHNEIVPWVLAGVGTVVGALSTALVYVFRKSEFDNAEAIKELKESNRIVSDKADKCEEDRHLLFAQCEVFKTKMETLESRVQRIDKTGTQYQHKREDNE